MSLVRVHWKFPLPSRKSAKSSIIEHEFQAKTGEGKEGETARVTFMAAGGDVKANIQRWKGQFAGGKAEDQKVEEMKLGNWQVYIVDVNGSFAEEMGGGPFAGGKVINRRELCDGWCDPCSSRRPQVLCQNDWSRCSRQSES